MTDHRDLRRGSVWGFAFVDGDEPKPCVVVSSDRRNDTPYAWVHVVRVTSRAKPPLPTIVELDDRDPVRGFVMCDEVEPVHREELLDEPWDGRLLTHGSMQRIDRGLRAVFDL